MFPGLFIPERVFLVETVLAVVDPQGCSNVLKLWSWDTNQPTSEVSRWGTHCESDCAGT
jgi:hypothetical protein